MAPGVVSDIEVTEEMRIAGNNAITWSLDVDVAEVYREMERVRREAPAPIPEKLELPDTLDVDDDGYPDDGRLAEIASGKVFVRDDIDLSKCWMLETFPKLAAEIGHGFCEIEDGRDVFGRPKKVIHYSTHGWSGCESFIAAVLSNDMLNLLYHTSWRRGGHYTFEVVE